MGSIHLKQRNMIWRNKKVTSTAHKIEMSVRKGKLLAAGVECKSKLVVPAADKLLRLQPEEMLELLSIPVKKGIPVVEGGSTFTGYVVDANTFQEVNAAYKYVKYNNMSARHIVCACVIPGENIIEQQEYEDDDEHGAGQKLLDFLVDIDAKNRAVYVTRHYDGTHIGPVRFDCIVRAAKSAINQKPYNQKCDSFQFSWPRLSIGQRGALGAELGAGSSDNDQDDNEIAFKGGAGMSLSFESWWPIRASD